MSRTYKDLKSHKRGFGKYNEKPQRKMTPFIHDANKISGKNEVLSLKYENDISQEDSMYNAKQVRRIRKDLRAARDDEKSTARTRIKRQINDEVEQNMLTELNDFMKMYNIESINFGKTHSIERTDDKLAKDVIKKSKNKS